MSSSAISDSSSGKKRKLSAVTDASSNAKSIEEIYTKKTQLEHILLRPDTYIGSIEKTTQPMWVLGAIVDDGTDAAAADHLSSSSSSPSPSPSPSSSAVGIVNRSCTFVPGLYKIFDEILVNAADNKQRDPTMSRIEVTIDAATNSVRVWNNGAGVPIVEHKEHRMYVPQLIFGNLLTGSNFDDKEDKTTGGRNGFGAKLANIFSTKFIVETSDGEYVYRQEFTDNMSVAHPPVILPVKAARDNKGKAFTAITFYPDLARFGMTHLDDDIVGLFSKRVYDIAGTAATAVPKLAVHLNGQALLPAAASTTTTKTFQKYMGMYQGLEDPLFVESVNDRWTIGVGISDGSFQQVSYVNSICTTKGGTHVDYVLNQITARLAATVAKKNKGAAAAAEIKPGQIKNHLCVFVNALIVNPAFDSQTKDTLTTKSANFGSECMLTEKMFRALEKSPLIEKVLKWAAFKQTVELGKKSGGGKRCSRLQGVPKLDDANLAGTAKSGLCTLILTEGDSAKALAVSGIGSLGPDGRNHYGVFPLKGKLLNVREASHDQIMKNEEIQNVAKILGLNFTKQYTDVSALRYGHLMIMTDQDHDGSHIKGLLINFLHHFWPSLLQIPGFLQQFITPIVKCTKGKSVQSFFTIPQYEAWHSSTTGGGGGGGDNGWEAKYYKGLGTSTAAEAKEYFSCLAVHKLDFEWESGGGNDDVIDMAFAKKRVEDRKRWLLAMEPGTHIDYAKDRMTFSTFVNKELILFSQADNERSIAHFMDGLKPSQRKVLFGCFKRKLIKEVKVVQLAGFVSEKAAYHHGEASLTQTIIGMAQDFVGSNNVNLLTPCGQFGTRLMGGKDAASPRYVFTKLEDVARLIFHPHDDALLEYQEDDGASVEPVFYVPVVPMALINGSDGIGTGWSSTVPTYNVRDVIANLRRMLADEEPCDLVPWYRGFTGTVTMKKGLENNAIAGGGGAFTVLGKIRQTSATTLEISELPVGKWTTDYKQFLETLLVGATAKRDKKDDGKEEGEEANEKDKKTSKIKASGAVAAAAAAAPFVKEFKENHTDTTVLFTVTVAPEKMTELLSADNLLKKFKLEGSVTTTNMNMFDLRRQICKFEGPVHVLKEFYAVRLRFYDLRKAHLAKAMTQQLSLLGNKLRFVTAVILGQLVVANRKKADLVNELAERGFDRVVKVVKEDREGDNDREEEDKAEATTGDYDYLLSMKIWSLTLERVQELTRQRDTKQGELDALLGTSPRKLWLDDLVALEAALNKMDAAAAAAAATATTATATTAAKKTAPKGKGNK